MLTLQLLQLHYTTLGIEALTAELKGFSRIEKVMTPSSPVYVICRSNLRLLRSIKISEEGMHSVTVDQAAYPPKYRIKPNRRLIVSLGTVVGLFLGIFLVFFVSFVQKQKETHS